MRFMNNIMWTTRQKVDEVSVFDDSEFEITQLLDEIISQEHIILIVPIQRNAQNLYPLIIEGPVSARKVIERLYSFYNEDRVVKNIAIEVKNDAFDYADTVRERIKRKEEVHWIDFMGDLVYFEGLMNNDCDDNLYTLLLGS